jgi:hypothetical protein
MYLNAESVTVGDDEGKFVLEVLAYGGPEGEEIKLTIDIHGIDLDAFYDQVKARIGPYLRERDEARTSRPEGVVVAVREDGSFRCDPDESGGYALDDPKHENYHSIHADIWDARDGK